MNASAPRRERGLRERIIDTATRMFAEHGFSGTSVRKLAEACGCTKPALYYYFDNKETLFREVVAIHMDRTSRMLAEAIDSPGPVRVRVHASVAAFVQYAQAEPIVMRLLQRIETKPEEGAPEVNIMATRELHLQMISNLLQQGIASGQLRLDVAPADCALVFAGTLSFQFEMALARGVWDAQQIHRTADLIFDGISA
jgi:AcrR family transcriptional regulator